MLIELNEVIKSLPTSNAAIKNTASTEMIDGWYPSYSASGQDVWLPEYRFNQKGIVVSAVGARCGKAFKADGKWNVCANTHTLSVDESLADRDYCWYMLNNENWWIKGGSAQPFVKVNDSLKRKHEFPSIDEQRNIVSKLDLINEMIELRKKELEKLDEIIKARFVELFGEPRSNPYGFSKKMLKDTCKVVTGNTPSRSVDEYYGDYVEWIKTDNIVSGLLNPTQATESLSEEGMRVGRTVEKDSILMACIAGSISSIGRVCVTDRKVAFNQQINAVVPEEYNILFLYVLLQLSKDYLVEEINMALKGILSKSKLEEKEFFVPPMDIQKQFADFVKQVDKSKVVVQKALNKTQQLFDSLKQRYFG